MGKPQGIWRNSFWKRGHCYAIFLIVCLLLFVRPNKIQRMHPFLYSNLVLITLSLFYLSNPMHCLVAQGSVMWPTIGGQPETSPAGLRTYRHAKLVSCWLMSALARKPWESVVFIIIINNVQLDTFRLVGHKQ